MVTPVPNAFAVQLWDASGPLTMAPSATDAGLTRTRVMSAASVNETGLKVGAGNIYRVLLKNRAAYEVFVKFYDKGSAVNAAADTPLFTLAIAAAEGFDGSFPDGIYCANGIRMTITKLIADTDTTVIAVNDVVGFVTTA